MRYCGIGPIHRDPTCCRVKSKEARNHAGSGDALFRPSLQYSVHNRIGGTSRLAHNIKPGEIPGFYDLLEVTGSEAVIHANFACVDPADGLGRAEIGPSGRGRSWPADTKGLVEVEKQVFGLDAQISSQSILDTASCRPSDSWTVPGCAQQATTTGARIASIRDVGLDIGECGAAFSVNQKPINRETRTRCDNAVPIANRRLRVRV
jgi:hypothetical protein